jgi:hypothetical protein
MKWVGDDDDDNDDHYDAAGNHGHCMWITNSRMMRWATFPLSRVVRSYSSIYCMVW